MLEVLLVGSLVQELTATPHPTGGFWGYPRVHGWVILSKDEEFANLYESANVLGHNLIEVRSTGQRKAHPPKLPSSEGELCFRAPWQSRSNIGLSAD